MAREGIDSYEKIYECQILDKYNLTDRKVPLCGAFLPIPLRHLSDKNEAGEARAQELPYQLVYNNR